MTFLGKNNKNELPWDMSDSLQKAEPFVFNY